jgi:Kef-type K+ transport system membrane component KefB
MDPRCLFLGILCTATSVGISARILSEHRAMSSPEGVTIMAAAVIDDVLGIVCLAIVVGIANVELTGTKMAWGPILWITVKSFGIWLGVTAIGLLISRKIADFLKIFKSAKVFAVLAFGFALMLAGLFEQAGLAMIVGAFVAGLSLSGTDVAFRIRTVLQPIGAFLVPVFFVAMGMLVDVRVLGDPAVLGVGLVLAFMATLGKVAGCALPSLAMGFTPTGALRVGVGMVPRCEVVLIIAGIAATTLMKDPAGGAAPVPIFDARLFGISVIMPLVTALAAPPLLGAALRIPRRGVRHDKPEPDSIVTTFDFRSEPVAAFAFNEIVELLQNDGFACSPLTRGIRVAQFRKDDICFSLALNGSVFRFTSSEADVPLIRTSL